MKLSVDLRHRKKHLENPAVEPKGSIYLSSISQHLFQPQT